MRFFAALMLLMLALPAYAATEKAGITFEIAQDLSVQETINFTFDQQLNESIDYRVDEEVRSVEVRDSKTALQHELLKLDGDYIIRIQPQGDSQLTIRFVLTRLVFENSGIYQFFTELSFNAKDIRVKVILPEGYGIYQGSYRPAGGNVSSDGRRMAISWSPGILSSPAIFSVKFEQLGRELNLWIFATVFAVAAAAFLYRHHQRTSQQAKEKAKQEFFTGFREDEKKVIEYMEKHGTAYQNKIEHEFKFSRAKMTRIVQKLAEKKLLAKKRKGRTNRLTWLKKD